MSSIAGRILGRLQQQRPGAEGAIQIDGVFGDELRGRIVPVDPNREPELRVLESDIGVGPLVVSTTEAGTFAFKVKVPLECYDGVAHVFSVQSGGASAQYVFVGDPMLRIPKALRSRRHVGARRAVDDALASLWDALEPQTTVLRPVVRTPIDLAERYGAAFPDALVKTTRPGDIIWFGVIDWNYRIQRPQHIAAHLADAGNRVFYISISFGIADERGRFEIVSQPHPGVFEIRLRLAGTVPESIYSGFTSGEIAELNCAVDEMIAVLNVQAPAVVVEFPSWRDVSSGVPGALVVHDCLDYVAGFSAVPQETAKLEERIIKNADVVVVSSQGLADRVGTERANIVIRNGADVERFSKGRSPGVREREVRPVIGYFGAIEDWFELEWIETCARNRPEWDFLLIGGHDHVSITAAEQLENVRFLGEQPYASLSEHLVEFDVAIIPFKDVELTRHTNPVKLYEYMAAGKPVVASAMPEITHETDMAYVATDVASFEAQIARALHEDSVELRDRRQAWAQQHTWGQRAQAFGDAIAGASPLVSVIVLAYNNWSLTNACLHSVLALSDYPNLEVIVVDNASTDETRAELKRLERQGDPRLRVTLNEKNLGFSAGNNVGIAAATGEYIILLNNDTYVTRGWVRDLIRPLRIDRTLGLVGPLTNNIGNEQRVALHYDTMTEMADVSRVFVRQRLRQRFPTDRIAFFCVAMRRDVIEQVGLLDEAYGRGFFEDDDYCHRVAGAGYGIAIVDDVFIHHHSSASWSDDEKAAQLDRNRAIYEAKWGSWKPHIYRDAPGFGVYTPS